MSCFFVFTLPDAAQSPFDGIIFPVCTPAIREIFYLCLHILKKPIMKKFWIITLSVLVAGLALFFYFRFYFVFGEGVKSGELNYVVYKGVLFKTYEGKLIQSGIRSRSAGTIQSYEFEFSVDDEALARQLMLLGGRTVELHYKEYFGALPWRGFTKFVVDSIVPTPVQQPSSAVPAPAAAE